MKKAIKIEHISPCNKEWSSLSNVEEGRFCQSCEKIVIDFSKMMDNELLEYFTNNRENICGYFNTSQTDRIIRQKSNTNKLVKVFASLLGFTFSLSAKSQAIDSIKVRPIVRIIPITMPIVPNKPQINCIKDSTEKVIYHLGGAKIQSIQVEEDPQRKLFKNNIYNSFEDLLRNL